MAPRNNHRGQVVNGGDPSPVATPVFDGATPLDVDEALIEWTEQNPDSPIKMLVDSIRNKMPLEQKFFNAGTQVVTADSVNMGNGLPAVSFDELLKMSADPAATAKFYTPFVKCMNMGWACSIEPIENEGK